MLATSYHYVNMPKRQASFNPEWTKEHEFISKSSRDTFHGFCTLVTVKCVFIYFSHSLFVYLCISIISRSPEMLCFLTLCQIICFFMYFFYFQKSRKALSQIICYISPEMLCFLALCTLQDRFISVVSFWNRHHNVLNKYKYCKQTLFYLSTLLHIGLH